MAAILNLAILDSAILVFPLKLTPTCQDWFPPFAQKNFTHSFWLNLMMAAILNLGMLDSETTMLDSDTLLSSLRFIQKHSHSTLMLTQTNSIWLKLIHSHLTWWWQLSWILSSWIWSSWIQPSKYFLSTSLTLAKIGSHHLHKKTSLIHSDSTWWWQPSWILPSRIWPFCTLWLTNSIWLELIHFHSTWWGQPSWILTCWIAILLKLIQSDSNSFILTQLDDGSHLEFCHLEFGNLLFHHRSIFFQTHSHLPRLVTTSWPKKTSLIHSDSTQWWQPSWILPCWIQTLPSLIQTPCYLLWDSLKNTFTALWLWLKLIQSDSNLFIFTQLDEGSHHEF